MLSIYVTLFLLLSTMRVDYVGDNRIEHFNRNPRGYGIEYYDPISFYDGEPRIGLESIPFTYNGITYTFSNAENKSRFIERFKEIEPRFGGWCAYSMTEGRKINFDPESYAIHNDSLYLFKDNESKEKFISNFDEMNIKAWKEWARILPTFDPKDSLFRNSK